MLCDVWFIYFNATFRNNNFFFSIIILKSISNKVQYKIQPCLFLLKVILKFSQMIFFLTIIHYIMITASFINFCDVTIEQAFSFARLVSKQKISLFFVLFFFCFFLIFSVYRNRCYKFKKKKKTNVVLKFNEM